MQRIGVTASAATTRGDVDRALATAERMIEEDDPRAAELLESIGAAVEARPELAPW